MKTSIISIGICLLFILTVVNPMTVAIDNVKKSSIPITSGKTLYVGGSGEGNYTSIQDALDNASDGDTVFVYDDSSPYYEFLIINKTINLIGENKFTTIIDGEGNGDIVKVATDWVNISSFTINNSGLLYSGIEMKNKFNTITNNIISNNYNGIYLYKSIGNNISNNIISNSWVAINLEFFSDNNTIKGNMITKNNFGIILCPANNVDILKNNISNNNHYGVCLSYNKIYDIFHYSDKNNIEKNNFFNNGQHAFFIAGRKNSWNQNYWGRPRLLPKIIYGLIIIDFLASRELYPFFPWISIDWRPAFKPYDI